jgi:hypothetical protein
VAAGNEAVADRLRSIVGDSFASWPFICDDPVEFSAIEGSVLRMTF